MFASLFSYKVADQLAADLAAEFHRTASRQKPGRAQRSSGSFDNTALAVNAIAEAARRLHSQHNLGFLQRARLAQQVQNRLLGYGYSVEVSRETAYVLSTALN